MRIVKSISLNSDVDDDVINKLNSCPNVSDYIKKLIRDDLSKKETFTDEQIDIIKDIVKKMIQGKVLIDGVDEPTNVDQEVEMLLKDSEALAALEQWD